MMGRMVAALSLIRLMMYLDRRELTSLDEIHMGRKRRGGYDGGGQRNTIREE